MPLCSFINEPLMWLQVLTVTGNHILYKAPDAGLHPVVTSSAASDATFAADFAERVPVPALNVKVRCESLVAHCHPSA
jgi:hypothetical protein